MYKNRNRLILALSVLFIGLFLFSAAGASDYLPQWEIQRIVKIGRQLSLSNEEIVLLWSIRKHENGRKGREFGVLHPVRPLTYNSQARWCAFSIIQNRIRFYNKYHKRLTKDTIGVFIWFMGNRYAPVPCKNDPKRLNAFWIPSVTRYWHIYYDMYIDELRSGRL